MNTKLMHLRLGKDETDTLDELAGGILSRQQVAVMVLTAALAAVRDDPGRLKFPPTFSVGMGEPSRVSMNDAPGKTKK